MAEKKENIDYNPDDLDRTIDHATDGMEQTNDYEQDDLDNIRPEDSVSNVSAPIYATSVASSVKLRRAAKRLQRLEEERACGH